MTTTVTWPGVLPLPTLEGYGGGPDDAVLRTEMESGPARQRKRFTQVPHRYGSRFRFNGPQFAIFRAWFTHKAKAGGEWFTMQLDSGLGLEDHEVRFVGDGKKPYQWTKQPGGFWIVITSLEARKANVLSEGVLDILLSEDAAGLLAAVEALKTLVNTTLPTDPW